MPSPLLNGLLAPRPYPILNTPGLVLLHDYTRDLDVLNNCPATSKLTTTRASSGTYTRADGLITSFGSNTARIGNLGLLCEQNSTNGIKNSSNTGAVAGSPGTLPTGWSKAETSGVACAVSGVGTEDGHYYLDLTFSGTATASDYFTLYIGEGADISAATGQTWTQSLLAKLVSGSIPNVTPTIRVQERTAANAFVSDNPSVVNLAAVTSTRKVFSGSVTLSGGGTVGAARPHLRVEYASGAVVDFTLRIYDLQFEQRAYASSFIPTTTVAVSRAADVTTINDASMVNNSAGTIFACFTTPAANLSDEIMAIYDAATAQEAVQYRVSSGGTPQAVVVHSGSASVNIVGSALTAGATNRIAFSWSSARAEQHLNGVSVGSDSTVTLPSGMDRIGVLSRFGTGCSRAYMKQIAVFNRALSAGEQAFLTSPAAWSA